MRRFSHFILAGVGGILLWAAWPTSPLTFLIFFAFIPLLWLEDNLPSTKKLFGATYLHMFVWNVLTTWWIYNSTFIGAALAILANSLLMCIPWLLMHITKKSLGRWAGYISLITYWISFEYIHLNWELSWPWLTLGNAFAMQPNWVQWYEVTGTTGGSLWILICNVLAYTILHEYRTNGRTTGYMKAMFSLVIVLLAPIFISKNILQKRLPAIEESESSTRKNVVVVQPNVDPYNEKFTAGTEEAQIQQLISLSEQQIDSNTTLVVWPETAIAVEVWENKIAENNYYQPVWDFLQRHPHLSLLSGIESGRNYGYDKKAATTTSRYSKEEGFYYDEFNTAAMLQPDRTAQFYHKAKLVPGVETLPSFLSFLGPVFEDFGGTSGTYGRDKQRVVFTDRQHYYWPAPIICYESIYGDYITEYVRKGANILTIVTNDGWWGNTQGYRQHMNYARLRAIETRRWIARSANTGISCFIDPAGNVYQPQPWDTAASIKMNIAPLTELTFFVIHGDYLSRIINIASVVFLIILATFVFKKRFLN